MKKCFTLVEMLVAVGIFAVVMTIASAALLQIMHTNSKIAIQRQVNQEARNILETIAREGKLAQGRPGETTITVPSSKVLTLVEAPKLTKTFTYDDNNPNLKMLNISEQGYSVDVDVTTDPVDILIAVDRSGSMRDECGDSLPGPPNDNPSQTTNCHSKLYYTRIALQSFVDTMNANYHEIGLVTFGSNTTLNHELTATSGSYGTGDCLGGDANSLKCKINQISYVSGKGCTNIKAGIQTASQELMSGVNARPVKKILIVVSDGVASCTKDNGGVTINDINKICPSYQAQWSLLTNPSYCKLSEKLTPATWADNDPAYNIPPYIGHTACDIISPARSEAIAEANNNWDSPNSITFYSIGLGNGTTESEIDPWTLRSISKDIKYSAGHDGEPDYAIDDPLANRYFYADRAYSAGNNVLTAYFSQIATQLRTVRYNVNGTLSGISLSSNSVNISNLIFSKTSDPVPMVKMDMTVQSPNYATLPEWRKAEITLKAIFSSRDYQ